MRVKLEGVFGAYFHAELSPALDGSYPKVIRFGGSLFYLVDKRELNSTLDDFEPLYREVPTVY